MTAETGNPSISRIVRTPGFRLGNSIGEFFNISADAPGRARFAETNKELDAAVHAAVKADASGDIYIP